mmetsp:Transcript_28547/g.46271  ORF Transcript_28547/g.46271 Transcript_28547/m.46271 type:complete len:88 (+) Transcript_28547:2-265(+)
MFEVVIDDSEGRAMCVFLCKYPLETGSSGPTKHPSWKHRSVNTIVRMYVREEGMRRTWVSYSCIQSIRIMFEVVIDVNKGRAMYTPL